MKKLVYLLLLCLLSCDREIIEPAILPPTFITTCLLKRVVSEDTLNAWKWYEESGYEYDGGGRFTKNYYKYRGTGSDGRITSESQGEGIYQYDANGFLLQQTALYTGRMGSNRPYKIDVKNTYAYQNGRLVKETNYLDPDQVDVYPYDQTKFYEYEGEQLVAYRFEDKLGTYPSRAEYRYRDGKLYSLIETYSDQLLYKYELQGNGLVKESWRKDLTNPFNSDWVISTFDYDALGRRIRSKTGIVTYLYEYDNTPNPNLLIPTQNGHPVRQSPFGTGGYYNLLSQTTIMEDKSGKETQRSTEKYHYRYNAAGIISEQLDQAGNVIRRFEYVNCP